MPYIVLRRYQPQCYNNLLEAARYAQLDDGQLGGPGNVIYRELPNGDLCKLSDKEAHSLDHLLLAQQKERQEWKKITGKTQS